MPPLYRMPIFYLALLVGGVGWALVARFGPEPAPPAPRPLDTGQAPAPPPVVVAAAPVVEGGSSTDGILRTPEGLRRKVLIRDLAVACRTAPGLGEAVGPPLDYFAIRFLHGAEPPDHPDWWQVGARGEAPQGWIPASSALEWDTRLMARPTPRAGRPRLVIYQNQGCAAAAASGQTCPEHGGACPTEGEETGDAPAASDPTRSAGNPTSAPSDHPAPVLGMPILRTVAAGEASLFEVASLVRDAPPAPIRPAEPPADLKRYLRVVDVAFVVDTTASMGGSIAAARQLASDLVASAGRRFGDVRLRLALIEYRDTDPRYGFVARRVTRLTDAMGFLSALKTISAASRGDNSVAEQVADGVALALPAAPGDPPGEHVDWPTGRAGQLATKLVVLLGDAPDHATDLTRFWALAERARAAGITVAAIAVDRPGMLTTGEATRYRDQWQTLAEGSYRPLDRASGFQAPVAPLISEIRAKDDLAGRLDALIADRVEQARTIAALAAAEAEGRLTAYVTSQGLTMNQIAPVLDDVHRGAEAQVARPDPRANGQKAPSVRRGWIASRVAGQPLVTVEILMSRDELRTTIDELTRVQRAASGTARDLGELLEAGTAAATGETSFLAADRGSQTFADHLRRRGGLPPPRPGSLLARTQADLLHADDLSLAALEAALRSSILRLTRRLAEPDWLDPRRTIDGMALVPLDALDF